jgi:hypothetical protein
MGTTWNASFEGTPGGGANPSEGDDRIRELKSAIRERIAKEHILTTGSGTDSAHGWHKAGAAMAYWTSAAPTLLPDGSTALSTGVISKGRLWGNSGSSSLSMWNGTTWMGIGREVTRVSIQGTLVAGTLNVPICFARTVTLARIYARCKTLPVTAGQPVLIDLHRYSIGSNGSVFSAPGKRLALSTTASFCMRTSGQMSTTKIQINPTNYLLVHVDAAGGTSRGSDLAVVIEALPR